MDRQDRFDSAVESLHEATLCDARWSDASALIDLACQCRGNHLVILDRHTRGRPEWLFDQLYFNGNSAAELGQEYVSDFYPRDERFLPRHGRIPRFMALADCRVVGITHLLTERERKTSPVYNEFLRRTEGQHGFNVRMDGPDALDIGMGFGDAVGTGGWSSVDVEIIERLLPHIRQFVRVRHALIRADARGAALTALLDNTVVGVIYLGRRGVILETNARAREILRRGEGLSDRDGVLSGTVAADDVRLGKLLADALPGRGRQPSSGSMTVERSLLLPRLVVHVNPLPARALDFGARNAVALVLLVDPGARAAIDADLVAATFRLTRAESQVAAALAEGNTVREIATATFRAESSVRWLVKQIHAKLGISRQADLVRLVLSAHHVPKRSP